ncbi:uncharacterized protein [Henckelia pumila]
MPESGVLCQREPAHLVDQNEPLDKFLLNQRFHQSFMEFADSCLAGESVHFYEEVQQPDKRNIEFKVVSEIGMIDNILKIQNDVKHELEEIHLGAIREVKEESGIDTEFLEVVAFRWSSCLPFFLLGGNVISPVVGM